MTTVNEASDTSCWSFFSGLSRRKQMTEIWEEEKRNAEAVGPKLGLFDLLCIGIGCTVGSGVLILSGQMLPVAGPAATLSWIIAGAVCGLTALSYIELCILIPTSGSCYAYSFHTLGEAVAVIGALCLTLEYGVSGAGVARSWASVLAQFFGISEYLFLWYPGSDKHNADSDMYIDFAAGLMMAICVAVVSSGLKFSKLVVNMFTVIKLLFVAFLIVAGLCAWNINVFASTEVFFPKGIGGVVHGASALFFGFVGFDEVCCLSGRTTNPRRTMPRALAGTLLVATVVSMLAQFTLSVSVDSAHDTNWPKLFEHKGWIWAATCANICELVLLPLIVLLSFLPQPELQAAMANDGLIPALFGRASKNGAFVWGSNISGLFMVLIATFVPFSVIWDVISLGVLLSFNITNTSLIMLRCGNGGSLEQPAVIRWLSLLWLCGGGGAYTLWIGFVDPALKGEEPSIMAAAAGCSSLLAAVLVLCKIHRRFQQSEQAPSTFRVPCVPFVPGAAIILNFLMMATISGWSHLWFFTYLATCFSLYLLWRVITSIQIHGIQSSPEAKDISMHQKV